ncbi:rna polymerase n-terminal domain-containing protein [Cystoisospora suis]|uniref:Rna polymerase n-terminal domain-containing protein n=1 Tax=Cystoisospora suis TaxID=483139 RepID=A0A2C6KGW4_9APIC|nr:rna polymerase n-terminal domain-containing protein [Cystoisospora suis]
MFLLSLLHDSISVLPQDMMRSQGEVLRKMVEEKYLNKVITDCGLVVAFHELHRVREARIRTGGDGSIRYKVDFTLVVFRPFQGEILEGLLISSDSQGLRVSLGFFEDIFLPAASLREPRGFNEQSSRWYWMFDEHELEYAPLHQPIRFRVREVCFSNSQSHSLGGGGSSAHVASKRSLLPSGEEPSEKNTSAMLVFVSFPFFLLS